MPPRITIRSIQPSDFAAWKPLWDGYNAFYGREGATALPDEITQATWQRFFDNSEPMHALVATARDASNQAGSEQLVGLVHDLFHRSTTRLHDVCHLQDLNALPSIAASASQQTSLQPCTPPLPSARMFRSGGVRRAFWRDGWARKATTQWPQPLGRRLVRPDAREKDAEYAGRAKHPG